MYQTVCAGIMARIAPRGRMESADKRPVQTGAKQLKRLGDRTRRKRERESLPVSAAIVSCILASRGRRASRGATVRSALRNIRIFVVTRRRRRPAELVAFIVRSTRWRVIIIARSRRWRGGATWIRLTIIVITARGRRTLAVMCPWAVATGRPAPIVIVDRWVATHRGSRTVWIAAMTIVHRLNLLNIRETADRKQNWEDIIVHPVCKSH